MLNWICHQIKFEDLTSLLSLSKSSLSLLFWKSLCFSCIFSLTLKTWIKSSCKRKRDIRLLVHIKTREKRQTLRWLSDELARSIWHHTRAHTYKFCMRQKLSQVSSSYAPHGVSPSCSLTLAHTSLHYGKSVESCEGEKKKISSSSLREKMDLLAYRCFHVSVTDQLIQTDKEKDFK